MGGGGRADEGRTEGTDGPQGGGAQAVEELQRAWADHRRRQERVERAEQEGGRQEEGRGQEVTKLVPFRQPAIPPEQEEEMQERAWRLGMQVRIRTNSLEFEFAPNSHEFVDHSKLEFATSNSNPP